MPLEAPEGVGAVQDHRDALATSALSQVIAPEIKSDEFYQLIKHLSATERLDTVLEIGSSSGEGSTEAFVTGLSQNPGSPKLFCIEVSKPRFSELQQRYSSSASCTATTVQH